MFQGIVPTLIIVQIGLGRDSYDVDTTTSIVRSDARAFTSTCDHSYDPPPMGPPPPISQLASPMPPPLTFSVTNSRTNRLPELRSRTHEDEEHGVSWLGSYIIPCLLDILISGRSWGLSRLAGRQAAVLVIASWYQIRGVHRRRRTVWWQCAALTIRGDGVASGPWDRHCSRQLPLRLITMHGWLYYVKYQFIAYAVKIKFVS